MRRPCRSVMGVWALTMCGGCAASAPLLRPIPPIEVQWEDEAARSGLAVLSVAPWEEYVATLQPEFTLKPADALAQAIPTTLRQQSELLDALTASLKVALPTSSTSSSTTEATTTETGDQSLSRETAGTLATTAASSGAAPTSAQTSTQTTTTTDANTGSTSSTIQSTTTSNKQPGNVANVPAPTIPALPPALRPTANPLDAAIERDPMVKYAAATALYQEVQLLNRYVRDAALRTNRRPYVVRLQVSILPQLRGQAYDAYAMLSFLYGELNETPVLVPYSQSRRGPSSNEIAVGVPTVIPLLVTDSLEQSAAATSVSRLRGFGLALLAMQSGVGLSGDFGRRIQTLQAAIGEDANSILTVTKVSDNVLRVRFGAINQIGSGLALQPRNHTVTVLMLLPEDFKQRVDVLSKLEVVRATDGVTLPDRPFSVTRSQVHSAVCKYITTCVADVIPQNQVEHADNLAYAVQAANSAAFNTALTSLDIDPSAKHRIWVDLLGIQSRSPYTATSFEVPPAAGTFSAPQEQLVTVIDDGTAATTAIRHVSNIGAGELVGSLTITANKVTASFPSTSVSVTGSMVKLGFPSVQKLKLCETSASCTGTVSLHWRAPFSRWNTPPSVTEMQFKQTVVLLVPSPATKPPSVHFAVTSGTRHIIRSGQGAGVLRLTFVPAEDQQDEEMFFTLEGADIVSVAPGSVTLGSKGWQVKPAAKGAATQVSITLSNLSEDIDVRVMPSNGKANKDPLAFRVRTATGK